MVMKKFINKYNSILRLLFIICLFIIGFASYNLYKFFWPTTYVSSTDNFSVIFPGDVITHKLQSEKQSDGTIVSGNIYNCNIESKGIDYAVDVTTYSNINFSKYNFDYKIATLQNQIQILAKTDNADISNGSTISFKNSNAVTATLTPKSKSEAKSYVLATLNQNKIYILIGGGTKQDQFKTFSSKFKFLKT